MSPMTDRGVPPAGTYARHIPAEVPHAADAAQARQSPLGLLPQHAVKTRVGGVRAAEPALKDTKLEKRLDALSAELTEVMAAYDDGGWG